MDITSVIPRPDFQLLLTYASGEVRQFDMRPLLAIKPWTQIATPALFAMARVDYGTVVWPNGIDLAPETLWLDSAPVTALVA